MGDPTFGDSDRNKSEHEEAKVEQTDVIISLVLGSTGVLVGILDR